MRAARDIPWRALLGTLLLLGANQALGKDFATNGIKLGGGRVHPFFDLGLSYESGAGFFDGTAKNPLLVGDMVATFRPGLSFAVETAETDLHIAAIANYHLYAGLVSEMSRRASHLEFDLEGRALLYRGAPVQVGISDHLSRSERTTNIVVTEAVLSLFNTAELALAIRPGGGALEMAVRAGYDQEQLSPLLPTNPLCGAFDATCDLKAMGYSQMNLGLGSRWRFLPKTAAGLDFSFGLRRYEGESSFRSALVMINGGGGLTGLLLTHLSVMLSAGYGFDLGHSLAETVIGRAIFNYNVGDATLISFGFERKLEPVPIFGVYSDDRVFVRGSRVMNEKLRFSGGVSYDRFNFYSNSKRGDLSLTVHAGAEYRFVRWFQGSLHYSLSTRRSAKGPALSNFDRHQISLHASLVY